MFISGHYIVRFVRHNIFTLSQNLIASHLLGFFLYPFPFFLTAVSLLYTDVVENIIWKL